MSEIGRLKATEVIIIPYGDNYHQFTLKLLPKVLHIFEKLHNRDLSMGFLDCTAKSFHDNQASERCPKFFNGRYNMINILKDLLFK